MFTKSIDTICRPIGATNLSREEQEATMIPLNGSTSQTLADFLERDPDSVTGTLTLHDCPHLLWLNLPKVRAITVTDCAGLTEIHAESASYVGALNCPDLRIIHADRAENLYVNDCPAFEYAYAPPAKCLMINTERPRRPVATCNLYEPEWQERILLEVNGAYMNLRQLLEADPYSFTEFSTTLDECRENGADFLTSLWLPAARRVEIKFGESLKMVDAPVAESIFIDQLHGDLEYVIAPMATDVVVRDEEPHIEWDQVILSDVLVMAPNRPKPPYAIRQK